MNISQELKEILSKEKTAEEVFNDIEKQQKDLNIKAHLIWAINIKNTVKDLLDNNFFEWNYVKSISLINDTNIYNKGNNLRITLFEDSENNLDIEIYNNQELSNFKKLLRKFEFDDININAEIHKRSTVNFKVDENLPNNILDLLLSKEMKTILEYSELEVSMPSQISQHKKSKL